MVREGIKKIMEIIEEYAKNTVQRKMKCDKSGNIEEECYQVNQTDKQLQGQGFTVNIYRTTSRRLVNGKGVNEFIQ